MILFLFKKFVSGTVLARQLRKPSGLTGRAVNMFMNSVNKQMNIATVSQLMIRPDHKILDIGFGGGISIRLMSQVVREKGMIVGMEMSDTALSQAQHKYNGQTTNNRINLLKGSIKCIPFHENGFDRACSVNTIYFSENPQDDFKGLYRILKPGGIAVITFRPPEEMKKLSFTNIGFKLYSKDAIISFLRMAGFKNIDSIKKVDENLGYICVVAKKEIPVLH